MQIKTLKEQILELRSLGKTYPEIAKQLSCSRGTISFHCNADTKQRTLERNRQYKQRLKDKKALSENLSECIFCKKSIPVENTFCSTRCQHKHSAAIKYENWIKGTKETKRPWLRKALAKLHGYKCSCCGISSYNDKPITLQVDHIDGNALNDDKDNLRLLCPNCHSQTDTFCGKNRGKGRTSLGIKR